MRSYEYCSMSEKCPGWYIVISLGDNRLVARNFNLCDILLLKNAGPRTLSLWRSSEKKTVVVRSTANRRLRVLG